MNTKQLRQDRKQTILSHRIMIGTVATYPKHEAIDPIATQYGYRDAGSFWISPRTKVQSIADAVGFTNYVPSINGIYSYHDSDILPYGFVSTDDLVGMLRVARDDLMRQ